MGLLAAGRVWYIRSCAATCRGAALDVPSTGSDSLIIPGI